MNQAERLRDNLRWLSETYCQDLIGAIEESDEPLAPAAKAERDLTRQVQREADALRKELS